ncbi:hypothetical protein BY458DRAFT_585411 [Sporodiniella umbellata]|nr:hypothetical protein BY458DRAFT_585411 [Sporodiniella umbellata]
MATASSNYNVQMQSTVERLEGQLLLIKNAQTELSDIIVKTKEDSLISDKDLSEIKGNMDKVSIYHTKLLSIKATMSMLSGRSKQLSVRAEKLKKIKIDYLSQVEDIKRTEKEKDQIVAASPIPKISNSTAIPKTVKKKKIKARQIALDDKDDGLNWKPQRKRETK